MSTTFSDFHFIAHDAHPTHKRQIPTFVRAHVMERYHREKRAKDGIQENGKLVWSQQPVTPAAPVKQGHILRWDDDTKSSKSTKRGTRRRKDIQSSKDKKDRAGKNETSGILTRNLVHLSKLETANSYKEDSQAGWKSSRYHGHVRGLMPKQELEMGGMRLVRALDDYYGVLDINQQNIDPWHQMWIPFAFTDPVLFHSCIAKFSFHAAAAAGSTMRDPEILKHLGVAIRGMSQAVTQRNGPISDSVLVSAICLCGIEMLDPDPSALRAHLLGARKMIELRGGLEAIKMDPVIMSGYFAYEYIVATIDGDFQVEAPLNSFGLPDPHNLLFPSSSGIFTMARKPVDALSYGFSQDTVNLLAVLCKELCISDVLKYDREYEPSLEDLLEILHHKHGPDHFSDPPGQGSQANPRSEDHVLKALLITASLQFPHLAPPYYAEQNVHQRIRSLQYHIRSSPIQRYWKPIPGAFIWCLMVALQASRELPERNFYVANLLRATIGVAFELLEPVRITLATFHRLSREQNERMHALHKSVEEAKTVRADHM